MNNGCMMVDTRGQQARMHNRYTRTVCFCWSSQHVSTFILILSMPCERTGCISFTVGQIYHEMQTQISIQDNVWSHSGRPALVAFVDCCRAICDEIEVPSYLPTTPPYARKPRTFPDESDRRQFLLQAANLILPCTIIEFVSVEATRWSTTASSTRLTGSSVVHVTLVNHLCRHRATTDEQDGINLIRLSMKSALLPRTKCLISLYSLIPSVSSCATNELDLAWLTSE